MRTSLNNIEQIENFIEGKMSTGDTLVFQVRLLLDSELRQHLHWQKRTASLINVYGRKKLREEIENIHHDIFNVKSDHFLKNRIKALFIKP
jgi:hypothetical protein